MAYKFATKAIHAGQQSDPTTGAVMTPIYQTSTYQQASPGEHKGYEYSRGTNPTRKALEDCLAALENGQHGLAFSSGMAATDCVLRLLKPGDEVVTGDDLYGGSYRIFTKVYEAYGITFKFVNTSDADAVREAITDKTKLIWVETPTNPTLKIADVAAIGQVAKEKKVLYVVDNTFASPYLQNPLDLGADIVMHSATKYINGHSDVVMGALVMNSDELYKQLFFFYNAVGGTPGPQDSFLALRGIKTLHLRMEAHCANGRKVAEYLRSHPKVEKIYWPGFEDHPGHDIAKKQMRDFGGMISIVLKGADLNETFRISSQFKVFTLAESLGGVESLINHPATMTHGSIPKEIREKVGVVDNLIRISVGIEDADDLIADLEQALV
ncbi:MULTISPECIES: cystathionine gamma-synthase [unclassified Sphingobacterium]|uniref:cystathionine gamma-synthase n=1 Tax=unclassified Sphingobacterium TaxID=2609468 RepID=UPI00104A56FA|nr:MULTISPECIES: cystathionine gamma-synthase [unclassified Sphingobacterium]MCS3554025.1 cystathionine gamma-lyase/cystathionine beta-lyase [Sphingobacterium sp. JUb21]QQD13667.1 cystathionine gamma-synthase [Sphingobacterium sp. UDSM-2020]TCR05344.1 cystathionine gamma-lyase/cystathionine beta-lyase [Sphingobacterium sp. JUb20]